MEYSTLIQENLKEIEDIVSSWPVNINCEMCLVLKMLMKL